jgi:hypothetical protein
MFWFSKEPVVSIFRMDRGSVLLRNIGNSHEIIRCHNPVDHNLNSYHRVNLKSHILQTVSEASKGHDTQ